jgi:hypothetical protein
MSFRQLYVGSVNNVITHCRLDLNRPNTTLDIFCWLIGKVLEKKYAPFFLRNKTANHPVGRRIVSPTDTYKISVLFSSIVLSVI